MSFGEDSLEKSKKDPLCNEIPKDKKGCSSEITRIDWRNYWDKRIETESGFALYIAGEASFVNIVPFGCHEEKLFRNYIFLIHGAGHTSLIWSLIVKRLKSSIQLIGIDMRGHGSTIVKSGSPYDFSTDTLSSDVDNIINNIINNDLKESSFIPKVIIIGHSMGGAIAARVASRMKNKEWLQGLFLLDIVEGMAISSLPAMKGFLNKIPHSFKTEKDAINWALNNRISRNKEAACISIPDQIRKKGDKFEWITDLRKTETYWKDWYVGLSKLFLSVPCPKVLILTSTDTLDHDLMIGQMQGKFQLVIVSGSGHAVQEDNPREVVGTILKFMKRQRIIQTDASPIPWETSQKR